MAFSTNAQIGIRAEDLDTLWNALISDFDAYYNSISPTTVIPTINNAISGWQDFYFGNTGIWKPADIERWRGIYQKTAETLKASIPTGSKAELVPVAAAEVPKSETEQVFYIQGNAPPIIDNSVVVPSSPIELAFNSAKWFIPLLVTLPSAYVLYKLLKMR